MATVVRSCSLCDSIDPHHGAINGWHRFQELDLTAEALLLGDTSRAAPWEQLIQTTLRSLGAYSKVMSKQLVGMLLCIFVQDRHLPFITEVLTGSAGVGIMGMMGNKGGVAIRFKVGWLVGWLVLDRNYHSLTFMRYQLVVLDL
jgi:hypothetical protein